MRVSVLQTNHGTGKAANAAQAARLLDAASAGFAAFPDVRTRLGRGDAAELAQSDRLPSPGSSEAGGPALARRRGVARVCRGTPVPDRRRLA